MSWPFSDPEDLGVITTRQVLDDGVPILLVSHDADDGGWQFLCGTTDDPHDGRIVHFAHLVARDPTLRQLADLPVGWIARRDEVGAPWERDPCEDDGD